MIIIPFALIILLAFAIGVFLKLKPIASMAVGVSAVIFLMLSLTLVATLKIAAYTVCVLSIALFVASMIYAIKKKELLREAKGFAANPAFLVFIFVVGAYTVLIRNNHLYSYDDFSYWGLSVKAFFTYNGFSVPYGVIRQGQTNAMPVFNAFISVIAGYKEGYLLCGMWFVYWSFLLLPIAHLTWKRWKTILIYVFLTYSLLMFTSHSVRPNLYNDIMLAVISGGLTAYYYNNKRNLKLSWLVILGGILILPHIKYFTGIAFAYFVLAACYLNKDLSNKFKASIKNKVLICLMVAAPVISNILQEFIRPQYIDAHTFTAHETWWCAPSESISSALTSYIGIALLAAIALTLLTLLFSVKKRDQALKKTAIAVGSFLMIVLFGYIYQNLDSGSKHLINAFIKNLLALELYEISLYKIMGVLIIINIIIYHALIKEELKRKYRHMSVVFIVLGLIYCVGVLATYTRFSEAEALVSASLHRYISSFVVFVLISAIGVFTVKQIYSDSKLKMVLLGVVLIYTVTSIAPAPMTLYLYEKNQLKYEQTELYQSKLAGEYIEDNTKTGDRIYLLCQGGNGSNKLYMQYFDVMNIFAGKISLGPSKYEGDVWSEELSPEEWSEYIEGRNFDYLYIMSVDDYFIGTYSGMFKNADEIHSNELYKIDYGEEITFEKVGKNG